MALADGQSLQSLARLIAQADPAAGKGSLSALVRSLATMTSWDAVIEVARFGQAITPGKADDLRLIDVSSSFARLVSRDDRRVKDPAAMKGVPKGAVIAFINVHQDAYFRFINKPVGRRHLVHAMISLGEGQAAGINNRSGIGIGSDGKWEVLDLAADLNWVDINISGVPLATAKSRQLRIRYRELEVLQAADDPIADAAARISIANLSVDFLKRVSVAPMDGVAQAQGAWSLVTAAQGQSRREMRLVQSRHPSRGGAWDLTESGVGATAPVCFLPWQSKQIVKLELRNDCPLFATAALTGCSIFTNGDARALTVYHAGITGNVALDVFKDQQARSGLVDEFDQIIGADLPLRRSLEDAAQRDPAAFWRVLLAKLDPNVSLDAGRGWSEVNKKMYVNDGSGTTPGAMAVALSLKAAHKNDLIQWSSKEDSIVMPWGSYIGFFTNGSWAMYLQENLTVPYSHSTSRKSFTASFPIALRQIFPAGRETTNLIAPVPDRIANPFTPSETVVAW